MPYFPTGESWTWASAPPKLSLAPPTHIPRIDHPLPNRPTDDGWTRVPTHRQTNISGFFNPNFNPNFIPTNSPRSPAPHPSL